MDNDTLVKTGRKIVKALEGSGVPLVAALWVRQPSDTEDNWFFWLAPKTFRSRSDFYLEVAMALAKVRDQIGYLEISSIKAIDPKDDIVRDLHRQFPKVSPHQPRYFFSQSLGGTYLKEGIVLRVA